MTEEKKEDLATRVKKNKTLKPTAFDLLDVTESLGYQTHRKNGRNSWSVQGDEKLKKLINIALIDLGYENGIADVKTIQESITLSKKIPWEKLAAEYKLDRRTAKDLRKRWTGSLDPNLKKGKWTKEEDELLIKSYEKHGPHWLTVSLEIAGRTEDQCAKRYIEVLGPGSKGRLREWSTEEDLLLISKVKKYGTKWRKISSEMEFRPSLTCRNRWRKIITLVVRGQASDEIAVAVKENKEIDLSIGGQGKVNTEGGTDNLETLENENNNNHLTLTNDGIKNESESKVHKLPPLTEITSPKPELVHMSHVHSSSRHAMSVPLESFSPPNKQLNIAADSPGTFSFINKQLALDNNEKHVGKEKKNVPYHSQTEWKFLLKDRQDLSLSNGVISSSEQVRELVEQARKFNLKITIHQHTHHHYGTPTQFNAESRGSAYRSTTNNPLTYSNRSKIPTSLSTGDLTTSNEFSTGFSPLFIHNNGQSVTSPSNTSDYKSSEGQREVSTFPKSPSSAEFGLNNIQNSNPGSQHSSNLYNLQNIHQARRSPLSFRQVDATRRSSTPASLSTQSSELPDVGPNRISHFNYLPPTIKPQLSSSDITKGSDLNKILNPSPLGSSRRRRKKRKRANGSYDSESTSNSTTSKTTPTSMTYTPGNPLENNVPDTSSLAKTGGTSKTGTPNNLMSREPTEDGVDFWETLHALADHNSSEEHSSRKNFDLYKDTPDKEEKVEECESTKDSTRSDSLIPLNPS